MVEVLATFGVTTVLVNSSLVAVVTVLFIESLELVLITSLVVELSVQVVVLVVVTVVVVVTGVVYVSE